MNINRFYSDQALLRVANTGFLREEAQLGSQPREKPWKKNFIIFVVTKIDTIRYTSYLTKKYCISRRKLELLEGSSDASVARTYEVFGPFRVDERFWGLKWDLSGK